MVIKLVPEIREHGNLSYVFQHFYPDLPGGNTLEVVTAGSIQNYPYLLVINHLFEGTSSPVLNDVKLEATTLDIPVPNPPTIVAIRNNPNPILSV